VIQFKRILKGGLLGIDDEIRPLQVRRGLGKGVYLWRNAMGCLQYYWGLYECELTPFYREHLKPGMVVWDIGAGDGDTTMLFGKLVGAGGDVYAFEPNWQAYAWLVRNRYLNWGITSGVHLIQGPVPSPVPAKWPAPEFIKIDINGGHLEGLEYIEPTIAAYRPVLVVETHSLQAEFDCQFWLSIRGYRCKIIKNAWWRVFLSDHRPIAHNRWLVAVHG